MRLKLKVILIVKKVKEGRGMKKHVCPWWIGYFLLSPVRKIKQNPEKILSPYVEKGMTCMDLGSAMGYFSLPMAKLTGAEGKVICIDLQEKMLSALKRRARRAGLENHISARLCGDDSLRINDLVESIDFALAFAMVHEVPDAEIFFKEAAAALRPGGMLLFVEPAGHVKKEAFRKSVEAAAIAGLTAVNDVTVWRSHGVLLKK